MRVKKKEERNGIHRSGVHASQKRRLRYGKNVDLFVFLFFLGGTSLHAQKRRPLDGFKSDFQMNEIKQDFTL